ncbi:hypothetical protein [Streptomyces sp. NPDC086519]|uniref:hypothetical protein n=1 Tax=Streptomyces sp. NPDC086519 TaxID=3154863 RepID=UPI003447119D
MTREQHLKLAAAAVTRAERLAADAERYATNPDYPHRTAPLAAAGALWSDIARTHTCIAAALPETEAQD